MGHFGLTEIVRVKDSFRYRRSGLHPAEANQMAAVM
jgi:hypothetical protein